jgi:hypothetical protein
MAAVIGKVDGVSFSIRDAESRSENGDSSEDGVEHDGPRMVYLQ